MLNVRTLGLTALTFPLLVACAEASFTGNAPNRATRPETKTPTDPTLSCTLAGDVGSDRAMVLIEDTLKGPTLYQTAIAASGETQTAILTYVGPEARGNFTRDGGAANEVTGGPGKVTVELRRDSSQASASAVCDIMLPVVEPPPPTPEPPVTVNPEPPNPPTNECQDTERKIGAEIAFLIDNSNSNASTDCPDDKLIGTQNGVDLYECQSETNREKAVLAAYDVLRGVAAAESGNALARSRLAIGSFPTAANYVDGWQSQTQGFLDVLDASRAQVAGALAFTRRPAGLTPYGAAMGGAQEFFGGSAGDQRAKLAVLVTDGEPTDQSPDSVVAKAAELKAKGVEVITVFVTSGDTREARETRHVAMLQKIDQARLAQTNGKSHWYDPKYASFDAYVQALLGGGAEPGVIRRVSDQIIEVQDSAGLQDAFLHIIKNEAVKCER